ncbi:MAG: hypothetical protein QNK05_21845 [Myxococcota bacterium]|nr:hypothetical protein [Myxococcota bacterium]
MNCLSTFTGTGLALVAALTLSAGDARAWTPTEEAPEEWSAIEQALPEAVGVDYLQRRWLAVDSEELMGIDESVVRAVHAARPIDGLEIDGDGFRIDEHGHAFWAGKDEEGQGGTRVASFLNGGPRMLTVDFDADGVVDAGFSDSPHAPIVTAFARPELEFLFDCIEQMTQKGDGPYEAAKLCLRGDPGAGGGSSGASLGSLPSQGPMSQEPDCGSRSPISDTTYHPDEIRELAEQVREYNDASNPESDRQLDATADLLVETLEDLADATEQEKLERLDTGDVTPQTAKDIHQLTKRARNLYDWYRQRESEVYGGSGIFLPPIDPAGGEPAPADPRCSGRAKQAAWGTLWASPEHCGGLDPLACMAKFESPLHAATGGTCALEPGEAGGSRFVCRERGVSLFDCIASGDFEACQPPDDGSGGSDPGDLGNDQPGPGGSGSVASGPIGAYVDLTPVGDVIALVCRNGPMGVGPCGGDPAPMDAAVVGAVLDAVPTR